MKRNDIPEIGTYNPAEHNSQQGVFTHGYFEENVRDSPNRASLHRHAFHELVFFSSGKGHYVADFIEYEIKAPCVVIIPSGTVHHWPDADQLRGDIIAFDLEFLGLTNRSSGAASVMSPQMPITIPLNLEQLKKLTLSLNHLTEEWNEELSERHIILRSYLTILCIEVKRLASNKYKEPRQAAEKIYAECLDLLAFEWLANNTPQKIAKRLQLSTDHLSASLRKVCGKNTSELIQERLILEAKRQLAFTRFSISEIAYALGFADPSYFTRTFRKITGTSPSKFKAENAH